MSRRHVYALVLPFSCGHGQGISMASDLPTTLMDP